MTVAELDPRIPRYRSRGVLLDANLLLLYLVGELDQRLVPRFKRTQAFTIEDFQRLKALANFFPTVVTLPGVLTEVSNLAGHLEGRHRANFFALFAEKIRVLTEEHVPSADAAASRAFPRLGLTDAAIILASRDKYLALTADFLLARFMEDNLLDVINFNYLRFQDWS